MPRIDPRLLAIMASSVILSTLVVLTFVKPREEDALILLGNDHPEAILKRPDSIGLESELSYTVMATRDLQRMGLRFSSLWERDPGPGVEAGAAAEDFPAIARLKDEISSLGGAVEPIRASARMDGEDYDAVIMDFSDFLEPFNHGSMLGVLPLVYMILTRGDDVRYFEGNPCFFLEAEENVDYLAIARNEEREEYHREGERLTACATISEAPPDGRLAYVDVRADERFSVTFGVDIAEDGLRQIVDWEADLHMVEMLQGHADGKLELLVLNVIPRGVEG